MTIFCISFYYKGVDFLRTNKALGNTVYLLTGSNLRHGVWPADAVDEFFYLDSDSNRPENLQAMADGFSWLIRERKIDRIVALDDLDIEKATFLREQFRIPGMGQTTGRYFRDKLAMRMRAADAGIPIPAFSALFNDADIHAYTQKISPPWVVKPRSEASAAGIVKIHDTDHLWKHLTYLGNDRYNFLIEQFRPGAVLHTDSLIYDGQMAFCQVSEYVNTPLEVSHGGGVFRSATVPTDGPDNQALKPLTEKVLKAFGLQFGASHSEFIRATDGQYYFLETSARVGGANLAEMVYHASGVNLWSEWGRIEHAQFHQLGYEAPTSQAGHAGILVSLSRFEWPDTESVFNAPEIAWRLHKKHHLGFVLQSEDRHRILQLLNEYADTVARDFHASAPPPEKLSNDPS